MKRTCLAAVVALLLVGPSVFAYSVDPLKESARGGPRSVRVSEPSAMVMLGMGFLALARQQRNRTVNAR